VTDRERHPADVVRLVIGATVALTGGIIARLTPLTAVERDLFHAINDLPDGFRIPFETIMQLGTLGAVVAFTLLAVVALRRGALSIALAGFGGYVAAHYAKLAVQRSRPFDVITGVVERGHHTGGYGYPSGHATVAAALAAAATPYLPRPARRAMWTAVVLVGIARIYVGAHFPLDVIGGLALGWAVGSLVNLAVGTPCHDLDPNLVKRALAGGHMKVDGLTRVPDDGTDATPYVATTDDGRTVFVKALDREHRNADALAAVGRYVAYRHVEDETPLATARQRVEHEALLGALAGQAGVHAARPLALASAPRMPSVLVLEYIDGRALDETDGSTLDDATLDALWKEVALLRTARIAHRHLSLENVRLDTAGQPWIVGFAYAVPSASDRELAIDVAELLASTALVTDSERALASALRVLGPDPLKQGLPLIQPLALVHTTRHELRGYPKLLDELREKTADAVGVEHPTLEPLTRVRVHDLIILASLLVATYVLLPQIGALNHTVSAMRHAEAGWLVLALLVGFGTFAASALSLSGSVLVPLAYGRTLVTQLAASFSNKITPAGLGGMGVNVRYLQRSGVSRPDAYGAVALNGTVGFVIHVGALVAATALLGKVGIPAVHLPSGWLVLVAIVVVLGAIGLLFTSFGRRKIITPTERTVRDLQAVLRRPVKAAQLLGGAVLVLASYILALGLSLTAFHAHASWLDVTSIYLGGSAVASAAPTPGKVGAVEAALIAGLTSVGIASGPAVAGVLAFRLVTFWLPILPGWLAFRSLTKRDLL
jgi:undecaprenyl-diphosphatase